LKEVIHLYTCPFLMLELTVLVGNAGHIRYPITDACPLASATWGLNTLSTQRATSSSFNRRVPLPRITRSYQYARATGLPPLKGRGVDAGRVILSLLCLAVSLGGSCPTDK
jgi:hypothetical protein